MKRILPLLLVLAFISGCAEPEPAEEPMGVVDEVPVGYAAYGEPVVLDEDFVALTTAALSADPAAYDGTVVRVEGIVADVCQMKGCWLTLQNPTATPIRVQVPRDDRGEYVFTFPTALGSVEAVVEGTVVVDTLSVDELRHYAEDEGRPRSAINAITEPQPTVRLMARGALVKVPDATVQS